MTDQQMLRSDASDSSQTEEVWRNEIQARVARYRTRRGRRLEGTFSMRFPFGATEEETPKLSPSAAIEVSTSEEIIAAAEILEPPVDELAEESIASSPALDATSVESCEEEAGATPADFSDEFESRSSASTLHVEGSESGSEFLLEPDPEPLPPPAPRAPVRRKIIAFPRQASNLEESSRLADPVIPEQPRILDVPEELEPFPTTPLLEGLQLPASPAATRSPDHVDLPAEPVSLSRRMLAGLVDCAVVLGGCIVFAGIAYKILPKLEPSKTLILGAAAVPMLLWAVYEYLMLMYAGTTLGMQVTKSRLSSFKGGTPGWRHRRSRVLSLYFSTASMMMGVLWSLVDVDALCWHDRISHTYLTRSE